MAQERSSNPLIWIILIIGVICFYEFSGRGKTQPEQTTRRAPEVTMREKVLLEPEVEQTRPTQTANLTSSAPLVERIAVAPPTTASSPPPDSVTFPAGLEKVESRTPQKFTPKMVKLLEPLSLPRIENKQLVGLHAVPVGTTVTLKSIKKDKVVVEFQGQTKEIPATSTDLIEQMVEAAEK